MDKGFSMTREALDKDAGDLSHALLTLAKVLMMRIGGSMGAPLWRDLQDHGQYLWRSRREDQMRSLPSGTS